MICILNKEQWHNDTEGLDKRAGGQSGLPFYLLIELLEREAQLTSITIRLVSNEKLFTIQRMCYRNVQRKLLSFWEQGEHCEVIAAYFLKARDI